MSILGFSSSYFLSQYETNTPLYGEKLVPLLDYVLSTDYANTEMLATAFYAIEDKYKNTANLPINRIEEVIDESGYGYIRKLLSDDEDSLRLFVYLLVMIHQLKGSKRGIETVLNFLKAGGDELELSIVGNPDITTTKEVSGFTTSDYIGYSNFGVNNDTFDIRFFIRTGDSFGLNQCIASVPDYGLYLGIDTDGKLVLQVGKQVPGGRTWQEIDGLAEIKSSKVLQKNTNYYVTISYSGHDYSVKVSKDGEKYEYYIIANSSTPLDVRGTSIYLGVDKSMGETRYPFNGIMYLIPFSVSSKDVIVKQWFENFPVEEEDTFTVEANIELDKISAEFFINFAKFAEKYVYPTLKAFRAHLELKNRVTFLPYVVQKVTYVSSADGELSNKEFFMAKDTSEQGRHYTSFLTEVGEEHSSGDISSRDFEYFTVPKKIIN